MFGIEFHISKKTLTSRLRVSGYSGLDKKGKKRKDTHSTMLLLPLKSFLFLGKKKIEKRRKSRNTAIKLSRRMKMSGGNV